MRIKRFERKYRDDLIFMVLQAKDALGKVPKINEDLLDVEKHYFEKGDQFWIAVDPNDRVIGCIGYSRIPGSEEAVLHRLYVKVSEKRKGIGSALLEKVETELACSGIRVAHVHLGTPKEVYFESYAFYEKHGYREYEPRYMKKEL